MATKKKAPARKSTTTKAPAPVKESGPTLVEVPEWCATFAIKALTSEDLEDLNIFLRRNPDMARNGTLIKCIFLAFVITDLDNNRVFTNRLSIATLAQRKPGVIDRLLGAAQGSNRGILEDLINATETGGKYVSKGIDTRRNPKN